MYLGKKKLHLALAKLLFYLPVLKKINFKSSFQVSPNLSQPTPTTVLKYDFVSVRVSSILFLSQEKGVRTL